MQSKWFLYCPLNQYASVSRLNVFLQSLTSAFSYIINIYNKIELVAVSLESLDIWKIYKKNCYTGLDECDRT